MSKKLEDVTKKEAFQAIEDYLEEQEMAKLRPFLDNLWRWKTGYSERDLTVGKFKGRSPERIEKTQMDAEFVEAMKNRTVMGIFRYGAVSDKSYDPEDVQKAIDKKFQIFKKTGNLEPLVDIANEAMIAFMQGKARGLKFKSLDNEGNKEYKLKK